MIKKTENCIYCGEKMESVTAKKKFCSPLHRVYWNRERKAADLIGKAFQEQRTEISKTTKDLIDTGVAIQKTTETGEIKRINPFSNEGEIIQRIAKIEQMLLMPQKYLSYNKRAVLEAELNQLKLQSN